MTKIVSHIEENLKEFLNKKITHQVLKRFAIILLYLLEFKVKEISTILKCSEKTAYCIIKKYKTSGVMNIWEKSRSGRKSLLNSDEILDLKKNINIKNSQKSQDKIVHIELVNNLVEKIKSKKYSRSGIYNFCTKHGIRKVKPRPVHIKNEKKLIEEWKENLPKIIANVKKKKTNKKVVVYYQDETRYGQKTITAGVWSPKGIRPEYKNQNGFLNSWIYGAINIERGEKFGLVLPTLDSTNMQIFLDSFSRNIKKNEHILLILDGSKAHANHKIIIPKNITLHFLPPYSPQLNPIERLWSYLKRNYLSFKLYDKMDDIIQSGSDAWNKLTVEIVKNIGIA
ncbi:IS630 family transposase [Pigmentibacter ruber]